MVEHEPRILQSMVAYTYLLAGEEIPWVAGLYNTFFWIIGGIVLFALAYRLVRSNLKGKEPVDGLDKIAFFSALIALTYYLILPFSVITSRSFQPDPGMVMWIILASYAMYRFSEAPSWKWTFLSGLISGLAILIKVMAFGPITGVLIATLVVRYAPRNLKDTPAAIRRLVFDPKLWVLGILAVAPALLFYLGRQERVSDYVSGWMISLYHLLITPGLYMSWAALVIRLFNPIAILAALTGLWFSRGRNRALLLGLWLGYILYGLFFPYQIGTHDYYHLMLVPIVALSLAPAFQALLSRLLQAPKIFQVGFIAVMIVWIGYYSWQTIRFYARENYRAQPILWQEIASHIPNDGKVIAVTEDFGMRLLYYGWRNVDIWPNVNQIEVQELRGKSKGFDESVCSAKPGTKNISWWTDFAEFDQQALLKQFFNATYHPQ